MEESDKINNSKSNSPSLNNKHINLIEIDRYSIMTYSSPYVKIVNPYHSNFITRNRQIIKTKDITFDHKNIITLKINNCQDRLIYANNIICLDMMDCQNVKVILSGKLFGYILVKNKECFVQLQCRDDLMPPISKQYKECYQYSQGNIPFIFSK